MVDECLIDVIKSMNTIIKDERAKIEKFRESDHKHYQESVDELHRKDFANASCLLHMVCEIPYVLTVCAAHHGTICAEALPGPAFFLICFKHFNVGTFL